MYEGILTSNACIRAGIRGTLAKFGPKITKKANFLLTCKFSTILTAIYTGFIAHDWRRQPAYIKMHIFHYILQFNGYIFTMIRSDVMNKKSQNKRVNIPKSP